MPTARAPREKVGSGGTRSHKEMKKWEECTSHFTQQTVDYGVVIAIYHLPLTVCAKGVRTYRMQGHCIMVVQFWQLVSSFVEL